LTGKFNEDGQYEHVQMNTRDWMDMTVDAGCVKNRQQTGEMWFNVRDPIVRDEDGIGRR